MDNMDESMLYCQEIPSSVNQESEGNETIPLSLNLQTRSRRILNKNPIVTSTSERIRIAKICEDFEDWDNKPCSVFGMERYKKYRGGFFFCGNCKDADDFDIANGTSVNRKNKNGNYFCTANHDNILQPTDRIKQISVAKKTTSQEQESE